MCWYLVHTKPRQETCALLNLERQGFECYLPIVKAEKVLDGVFSVRTEPLFPRYLFVRFGRDGGAQSWGAIRSTKGVNRLVSFGLEPAKVNVDLVNALRLRESAHQAHVVSMFAPGDRVCITDGPFAGVEGVYKLTDGNRRVMVLIEMLSKTVALHAVPGTLRRVG